MNTNRDHFQRLDDCAEYAPEGTYEREKEIAAAVNELTNAVFARVKSLGLNAPNGDQIEAVCGAIYGYIRDANPLAVAAGEGFGTHVRGAARERIIAQAIRDRDFIQSLSAQKQ